MASDNDEKTKTDDLDATDAENALDEGTEDETLAEASDEPSEEEVSEEAEEAEEDPAAARRRAAKAAVAAVKARKKAKSGRKKRRAKETAGDRLAARKEVKAQRKAEEREAAAAAAEAEALAASGQPEEEELPPDEMQVAAESFLEKHQRVIVGGMAGIAVLGIVFLAFQFFQTQTSSPAAQSLAEALDTLSAPVTDSEFAPEGVETFESFSARAESAAERLENLRDQLGSSAGADIATLASAIAHYDLGDYETAREEYEDVLQRTASERLQAQAIEGIAFCYEAEDNWEEARAQYERLEELSEASDVVLTAKYHLARVQVHEGDREGAIESFASLLDELAEIDDGVNLAFVRDQTELQLGALDSSRIPASAAPSGLDSLPPELRRRLEQQMQGAN